jgi:hypothetical protein
MNETCMLHSVENTVRDSELRIDDLSALTDDRRS